MRIVRGFWRLLVGIKDGLVLLAMLIFFGLLFAALSLSPNPRVPASGALLVDLDGSLVEQPSQADPLDRARRPHPVTREYRLRDVIRALDAAADRRSVKAVVLDLDRFTGGGQAAIAAAARAVDRRAREGQAGARLRHRLYRRRLPARRARQRDLARSVRRGADRRAGRRASLL